jgi:hypothetical protein
MSSESSFELIVGNCWLRASKSPTRKRTSKNEGSELESRKNKALVEVHGKLRNTPTTLC